jgi:nicotinamidase-related amidase
VPRAGLLLVDVLNDFRHEDGELLLRSFRERGAALVELVEAARRHETPIVYANDNRGVWDGDAPRLIREARQGLGGDLIARYAPRPCDRFVVKPRYSAFDLTPLCMLLRSLAIDRVTLAGAATEMCVVHTALTAEQLGFEADVVASACACVDRDAEGRALAYLRGVPGIRIVEMQQAVASFVPS